MTNSDKFKQVFGLYATELWAMTETEFLAWLNADAQPERKTGQWIDAQYPYSKCDKCGSYMDTVNNEANYCCVCGARMEE